MAAKYIAILSATPGRWQAATQAAILADNTSQVMTRSIFPASWIPTLGSGLAPGLSQVAVEPNPGDVWTVGAWPAPP